METTASTTQHNFGYRLRYRLMSPRSAAALVCAGLIAGTSALAAPSATADPMADLPPDTPTSSDGTIGAAPTPTNAVSGEGESSEGTGDPSGVYGVILEGDEPDPDAIPAEATPPPSAATTVPRSAIEPFDIARNRVSPTTQHPARVIGLLTFKRNGVSYRCSAFLYGDDIIGTAGHCVYANGTWSNYIRFYPGRDGSSSPFGHCAGKKTAWTVTGWTNNYDPNYDYGAIRLNCAIGRVTGFIGLRWQTASLTGTDVRITGYPAGKSPTYSEWTAKGPIKASNSHQVFYPIATYGGDSGAPAFGGHCSGSSCHVLAIHAYGKYGGSSWNRGTRINQTVYQNLYSWK